MSSVYARRARLEVTVQDRLVIRRRAIPEVGPARRISADADEVRTLQKPIRFRYRHRAPRGLPNMSRPGQVLSHPESEAGRPRPRRAREPRYPISQPLVQMGFHRRPQLRQPPPCPKNRVPAATRGQFDRGRRRRLPRMPRRHRGPQSRIAARPHRTRRWVRSRRRPQLNPSGLSQHAHSTCRSTNQCPAGVLSQSSGRRGSRRRCDG